MSKNEKSKVNTKLDTPGLAPGKLTIESPKNRALEQGLAHRKHWVSTSYFYRFNLHCCYHCGNAFVLLL